MKNVQLKKAIESGAWHECSGKYFGEERPFRIRVLGFCRKTIEEIDQSLLNKVEIEGILWLMSVELVSLCKKPVDAVGIRNLLTLTDEEGFQFEPFSNSDLDRNKNSGLHRFSDWSDSAPLSPKIKAIGSIAFVLPDEENNYYLGIKDGQIRES